MRKNRIICFVVILSLLLSSSALALGNDFTFSSQWFKSVVDSSLFECQNKSGSYDYYYVNQTFNNVDSYFCNTSSGFIGSFDNPSSYVFYYHYSSNGYTDIRYFDDSINITSPLGLTVRRGQTINLQSMLFVQDSNIDLKNVSVRFNLSNGTTIVNVPAKLSKDSCDLGTITLNSNGVPTNFTTKYSGYGHFFDISWTNLTDEDVYIKSVRLHFDTDYTIYNFRYGFFAEGSRSEVVLPSYVEDNLSMISSELISVNDNLEEALDELEAIKSELLSIAEKLNQSGGTTNNYYQTITQATEEQVVKQEQLDELVATARSELEEMKETLNTVTVPTASDVASATTSQATKVSIDDALGNQDLNKIFSTLFQNSTITTMLLMVVSIATVGYVLFGKRG